METSCGNIFRRKNRLDKAGDRVDGHAHNFDHLTVIFTGAVRIKAKLSNGQVIEQEFHAPTDCLIRADVSHEITALEDNTEFWCIYSHRTPQGDVTLEDTGWHAAYV